MNPKAARFFRLSIILFLFWIVLTVISSTQKEKNGTESVGGITLETIGGDYARGQLVQFQLKNNTAQHHEVKLKVEERLQGRLQAVDIGEGIYSLNAGEKRIIDFPERNIATFGHIGQFRAELTNLGDNTFIADTTFSVEEPGFFLSLWRTVFFKPIQNALIFLLSITNKHLWLAIILLTLIIKTLLLVPSKKAIVAQQKMQKLQPELNELRKKYAKDPQKQSQEMMALWKKHDVHPGSALWPILIQFPILIALFYVVREGLQPHNAYLLYPIPFLQNFDFSNINFHFFWISLDHPDPLYIIPVTIGLLQFFQMKTVTARQKKQAENGEKKEPTQQESMMKMMNYLLPGMVAFFSLKLPAAVGLYWGISTIFSIIQQEVIHHKKQRKIGGKKKQDTVQITS